jgi:hypothetical protein
MESAIPIKDKLPTDVKNRSLYFHLKYIKIIYKFIGKFHVFIKIIYKFMKNPMSH